MDILSEFYVDFEHLMQLPRDGGPNFIGNLPKELLMLIADHCLLEDGICLAATCKSFAASIAPLLRQRANKLTRTKRIDVLWQLLERQPELLDYCVCRECLKFHRLYPTDLPSDRRAKAPCPSLQGDCTRNITDWFYGLRQHHVSTILRYSRAASLTRSQKAYLTALFKPHRYSSLLPQKTALDFLAKPRVVHGSLLLYTRYTFTSPPGSMPVLPEFRVSPHQHYREGVDNNELSDVFATALDWATATRRVVSPCHWCRTDFCASANEGKEGKIVLEVWQDVGTTGHPNEREWKMQVADSVYSGHGEPGRRNLSVLNMYEEAEREDRTLLGFIRSIWNSWEV